MGNGGNMGLYRNSSLVLHSDPRQELQFTLCLMAYLLIIFICLFYLLSISSLLRSREILRIYWLECCKLLVACHDIPFIFVLIFLFWQLNLVVWPGQLLSGSCCMWQRRNCQNLCHILSAKNQVTKE